VEGIPQPIIVTYKRFSPCKNAFASIRKGNGGFWKSVKDGCDLVAGSWSWSFVCALTRAPTLKRQLKETTEMMMTMMWILMEVEIVMVMVLRRPDIFDSEEGSKALDAAY